MVLTLPDAPSSIPVLVVTARMRGLELSEDADARLTRALIISQSLTLSSARRNH